jgi:hypothetical protein
VIGAIHQPNFFPWLGYFDKLGKSDVLILLDDVDYPRAGSSSMGSWCNRVRADVGGREQWIGCPVARMPLGSRINEARVATDGPWRRKLKSTLRHSYSHSPSAERALKLIEPLIDMDVEMLSDFNHVCIKTIAQELGLSPQLRVASEFNVQGTGTDRLIGLLSAAGADTYLCGGGSAAYLDEDAFSAAGIKLVYQNFLPEPYGDPKKFIPGLSIIDFLMKSEEWIIPSAR